MLPAGCRLPGLARVDCRAVAPWLFDFCWFLRRNERRFSDFYSTSQGFWYLALAYGRRCRMAFFFVEASFGYVVGTVGGAGWW